MDNDWFRFLRSLSGVEEVNLWRPGGKGEFKALKPGGLFLFKLRTLGGTCPGRQQPGTQALRR